MKKSTMTASLLVVGTVCLVFFRACTSISIAPECPTEMRVGESREVFANETNPGAIATYRWEVFPITAGTFSNPTNPNTRFQALREGDALLRLTASDGLYQVISECHTQVQGFVNVAVRLLASDTSVNLLDPVTLTCESVGATEAVTLNIVQITGGIVELIETAEGIVRFEADRTGDLMFRCVGENAAGEQSEPTFVTVNVATPNINSNSNANSNNNDNENENDNRNDDDEDENNSNMSNDNSDNDNN